MKFITPLCFFLFLACNLKTNEKLTVKSCRDYAIQQQYQESKNCLLSKDSLENPLDQLLLAEVHKKLGEFSKAEYLLKQLTRSEKNPIYDYHLGRLYQDWLRYDQAKTSFQHYLDAKPQNPRAIQNAKTFLKNYVVISQKRQTETLDRVKLDSAINTIFPEYGASLSIDQKTMIFTRLIDGQEDLFEATKTENGWKVRSISELNSPANEGAHCLSADGKILIFTICGEEGYGSCDLFYSIKQNKKWTSPQNMGSSINTAAWESQPSLSADGNYLFFSSDRKGGKGGKDIWVSVLQEGDWSIPKNLGDSINSSGNEESPFFHPDGRTLYFSSDSWPGHGLSDIFVTQNLKSNLWTKARNLGGVYNNEKKNLGFFVNWSGQSAFITDSYFQDGKEFSDIVEIELLEKYQPKSIIYIDVFVQNKIGNPIEGAKVDVSIAGKIQKTWYTDDQGKGFAILSLRDSIELTVNHPDYVFFTDRFIFERNTKSKNRKILIELVDKTSYFNETRVLKNVLFETGSSKMKSISYPELQALVQFLKQDLTINIEIRGHTDNVGSPEDNLKLSEERANAVKEYLVGSGIESSRIDTKGFGETLPLASNNTKKGRTLNRRTEFVFKH